jgi:hypothetical protein
MNKVIYPLSPCPWCRYLPTLKFYFVESTWRPKLICDSSCCTVNPESKPQNVRKTCKTDLERLKEKMKDLFDSWNKGNPFPADIGLEIDFDFIIAEGKKDESVRRNKYQDI